MSVAENSVQLLLSQLQSMADCAVINRDEIEQQFLTNNYRPALMEALVERKDIARSQMDPTFFEKEIQSNEIDAILEELNHEPTVHQHEDEELERFEKNYDSKRLKLRKELNEATQKIQQKSQAAEGQMYAVLRSQMRIRPIDEQDFQRAMESVRRRHEAALYDVKQYVANCLLVHRRNIEQARKKRKNFDKDTTYILQTYFDKHLGHPYPSEEDKHMLAAQCGITVQQVNNWFGNQRIRRRKQIEDSRLQNEHQNASMNYVTETQANVMMPQEDQILEMEPQFSGARQKLFIINPQPQQVYYSAFDAEMYNLPSTSGQDLHQLYDASNQYHQ